MRAIFISFFNDTATTEIYTLSLHDALPISAPHKDPRMPQCPTMAYGSCILDRDRGRRAFCGAASAHGALQRFGVDIDLHLRTRFLHVGLVEARAALAEHLHAELVFRHGEVGRAHVLP